VTLPDSSQTTTLTASVSEQADISVPSGISFNVLNVANSTAAAAASVTINNIVLSSATKQLKLSVKADAASFTPPVAGAATWGAGDVTWNAAAWTNGTAATGTLSNAAFNTVATSTGGASAMSTTGLVFTLAGKNTVNRSGNHTLNITWKVESIGS
ncbi:MAG: hypothetical protein KY468_07205, partial [Armatimonadetes bacterium]|nr:hypothetical protein [Armatimonadota bacterium]